MLAFKFVYFSPLYFIISVELLYLEIFKKMKTPENNKSWILNKSLSNKFINCMSHLYECYHSKCMDILQLIKKDTSKINWCSYFFYHFQG